METSGFLLLLVRRSVRIAAGTWYCIWIMVRASRADLLLNALEDTLMQKGVAEEVRYAARPACVFLLNVRLLLTAQWREHPRQRSAPCPN